MRWRLLLIHNSFLGDLRDLAPYPADDTDKQRHVALLVDATISILASTGLRTRAQPHVSVSCQAYME
jgi:hypothetical protein